MAKWGKCDYRSVQRLRDNLQKLQNVDLDKFCQDASKELAARLLVLTIKRTPVGRYPKETGKKGGTLRRGWTAKTEQEAQGGSPGDAKTYAKALPVKKQGGNYIVEVINPVHYASYVEFGHRTANGRGWVAGRYFLTISEQELEQLAPALIERKLEALLKEAFRG